MVGEFLRIRSIAFAALVTAFRSEACIQRIADSSRALVREATVKRIWPTLPGFPLERPR